MGHSIDNRASESLAQRCAADPELFKAHFGVDFADLDRDAKERLQYDWEFWGRRKQQLNTLWAWTTWVILAGRGFGKTRLGAEAVRRAVEVHGCRRIALVARTSADCTRVMICGTGGIISVCPPWNRPVFERSKCQLTWPNGAIATYYTADKPDSLRGPEHDFAWCDEIATWRYLEEAYDNLQMGLRIASGLCRTIVTTTPRRIAFLKRLIESDSTLLTKGSTFENIANLHPNIRANLLRIKGTSKERQELYGDLVGDIDGALWTQEVLDEHRHKYYDKAGNPQPVPNLRKVVCGVDPATTCSKDADDTGIVVAGLAHNGRTYVLGDYTQSNKAKGATSDKWAVEIVRVCLLHKVNELVVETNAGGDLIAATIRNAFKASGRTPHLPRIVELRSTQDKSTRAEPVQALYQIGMVSHVGRLSALEDEMTSWVPAETKKSPNRIDALVFAVNGLNPNSGGKSAAAPASPAYDYAAVTVPKLR